MHGSLSTEICTVSLTVIVFAPTFSHPLHARSRQEQGLLPFFELVNVGVQLDQEDGHNCGLFCAMWARQVSLTAVHLLAAISYSFHHTTFIHHSEFTLFFSMCSRFLNAPIPSRSALTLLTPTPTRPPPRPPRPPLRRSSCVAGLPRTSSCCGCGGTCASTLCAPPRDPNATLASVSARLKRRRKRRRRRQRRRPRWARIAGGRRCRSRRRPSRISSSNSSSETYACVPSAHRHHWSLVFSNCSSCPSFAALVSLSTSVFFQFFLVRSLFSNSSALRGFLPRDPLPVFQFLHIYRFIIFSPSPIFRRYELAVKMSTRIIFIYLVNSLRLIPWQQWTLVRDRLPAMHLGTGLAQHWSCAALYWFLALKRQTFRSVARAPARQTRPVRPFRPLRSPSRRAPCRAPRRRATAATRAVRRRRRRAGECARWWHGDGRAGGWAGGDGRERERESE